PTEPALTAPRSTAAETASGRRSCTWTSRPSPTSRSTNAPPMCPRPTTPMAAAESDTLVAPRGEPQDRFLVLPLMRRVALRPCRGSREPQRAADDPRTLLGPLPFEVEDHLPVTHLR